MTNQLFHSSPDIMDITSALNEIGRFISNDSESKAIWLALRQLQDRMTRIEKSIDVMSDIAIKQGHALVASVICMQQLRDELKLPSGASMDDKVQENDGSGGN